MRLVPVAVALVLLLGVVVAGAVWALGRAARTEPTAPVGGEPVRLEVVERASEPAPAPAGPGRREAMRAAWPEAALVSCPLEGRLRFSVMPLHVRLDQPGEPAPFDFAVVDDALLLAVPPGAGAANLVTGDGAGLGRLGWDEVGAGGATSCTTFRWREGPLRVPGEVRGEVAAGTTVRACGEAGTLVPVDTNRAFTLVLERSATPCRIRLEAGGRVGPWGEVRADRLDGTVRVDPLPGR